MEVEDSISQEEEAGEDLPNQKSIWFENNSEDDDYDPHFDNVDYNGYGMDDDWLRDMETEYNEIGTWIGGTSQGCKSGLDDLGLSSAIMNHDTDMSFTDNEQLHGAIDSDEECIGYEINSDGEKEGDGYPEFNPKTDMLNPQFCNGMKFSTAKILRAAIRERAIQKGWGPSFYKSESWRVDVVCKAQNCPFQLYASQMQHESTLQIKRYNGKHTCARVNINSSVRVPYLTEKFSEQIKLNPSWETEALRQHMKREVKAKVSYQQVYRTKKAALKLLEASVKEQYARVKDYAAELVRVDPNTTVDIKCDFPHGGNLPVFKRMYVCLGALKKGFIAGCRSIIGLDGCHLKSVYGGQLLTAVGLDANNSTWVLAYAMVEMESKDSWLWFLDLLAKDLDIKDEGVGWAFISDRQKGLIPALAEMLPLADHRFCVRHMWTNFNKLFKGKKLKDQLWACAKATTKNYFLKEMAVLKTLDLAAYDWLASTERPPKNWSRAFFRTHLKCDILLNNLCESFNAWIVPCRSQPIVTCFEEIRVKLMKRIQERKDKMMQIEDKICPKPREILELNKIKAADCIPIGSGGPEIEVFGSHGDKYVVNLRARICACRRWDLTGIPCRHAISAANLMRHAPENYVDSCYMKDTYMASYLNCIKPVNGMELWSKSDGPPILPPQYTRQPGRPKKKRTKNAAELDVSCSIKLPRNQRSLKCGHCGEVGHNRKSCRRHLPPKEKTIHQNKKRKLDVQPSMSQANLKKNEPLTNNDNRKKIELKAHNLKEKKMQRNKHLLEDHVLDTYQCGLHEQNYVYDFMLQAFCATLTILALVASSNFLLK